MDGPRLLREASERRQQAEGLAESDAHKLFAAMLDGGLPDLELGAALATLGTLPGDSLELLGFSRALHERVRPIERPASEIRPLVIPSYGNVRDQYNLVPLVATLLARIGIPVVVHGTLEGAERISSAAVFRELGVMPCTTSAQIEAMLELQCLAFVPTGLLSPGLAKLIALRGRLGVRNVAHIVARLLDPFAGGGLRMTGATHPGLHDCMRDYFLASGDRALLLRATSAEPFANPRHRPTIELIESGSARQLFAEEHSHVTEPVVQAKCPEARATALYTRSVLEGQQPVPMPIVNQVACCLYGAGYASDFNQAKAIVAVETRAIATV